jgi:hypothetical protein
MPLAKAVAVYGGWTDRGIAGDMHVLRRDGDPEGPATWLWSRVPLGGRDHAPDRATYGHSLNAVPADEGDGEGAVARLLVCGGVAFGGYRGASGAVHSILVTQAPQAAGDEGGSSSGAAVQRPSARLRGAFVDSGPLSLGVPRAYHTATYLPWRGGAHESNARKSA